MADLRGPIRFAAVIGGVLGLVVASSAALLAPRIAHNAELERRRHVLRAVGIEVTSSEIDARYRARIVEERVILAGVERVVYRAVDDAGATTGYGLPVDGPGLWGPIEGYLALDASVVHILGLTFYAHRETPGLGAQISDPRWAAGWQGKSIVDPGGHLAGIRVERGARPEDPHAVDAISGATLTSRAVEAIVRRGLDTYRPYLEARWRR